MRTGPGQLIANRLSSLLLKGTAILTVVMAIATMPVCQFGAQAVDIGLDARTITEQRSITEHLATPGVYQLHQTSVDHATCEACRQQSSDPQQAEPSALGTMQDFTQRAASVPPVVFPILKARGAQFRVIRIGPRTGLIVGVESPPPRISPQANPGQV